MLLSVENVSKSFGALKAVNGVSLEIDAGEIVGIAGPNGSGKSTLFNVITAIPEGGDGGRVLFDGQDVSGLTGYVISRLGIARTFQRESIFASLSAVDNVLVAVENNGRRQRGRQAEQAAYAALDAVGFPATMLNVPASGLPVYFRKILMIASALAMRPRLLLLDEPASSLIPSEIDHIEKLILSIRASGVAVLLIEHVLPLLLAVSDRLVVLDQGEVIASGGPREVIADSKVIEAYLGVAP